jgi:beta-glucuronidase
MKHISINLIPACFAFLFLCSAWLFAQSSIIQNAELRAGATSLNGKWHCIIDPYENGYYDYRYMPFDVNENAPALSTGFFADAKPNNRWERLEYNFDTSPTLYVPGDWNSQDEKLFWYEGTVWYRRKFDHAPIQHDGRTFIHFGAVNYKAEVYLNGKKLGVHVGGFTPFQFEVSGLIKPTGNSLVVKVDNKRCRECVPTLNTDWFNYGGITRDVHIISTPATFIEDYLLQVDNQSPQIIQGFVQLNGQELVQNITVEIPELKIKLQGMSNGAGRFFFKTTHKKIQYWHPERPKLYEVLIKTDKETVKDKIGFRSIRVSGEDILLNGEPIFLRGICAHEENPMRGSRAHSEADAQLLVGWAAELNCNFMRLAHYPHNVHMARTADVQGMLLWEEIPVYWTILWQNPETYLLAEKQLQTLIQRDKNRASVIIWSVANETPVSSARNEFLRNLIQKARQSDPTRLISAALEKHPDKNNPLKQVVEDPIAADLDIVSFNQYVGWYDGLPDKCRKVSWEIPYQKPVLISEFGGGALEGWKADSLTIFSENFQEWLYKETLPMVDAIPQLRGMSPWLLADFRSPRRLLPNVQDGWNRKGLYGQTGHKKLAYYVLKNYYDNKALTWRKKR